MSNGYVSIYRQLINHWVWNDKPYSRGQAWIDLILRANYADATITYDGKPLVIERGTFMSSDTKLAEAWGWSRKKTARFIDGLKSDHMMGSIRHGKGTVYNIVNYSDWQDMCADKEPIKHRKSTAEAQQKHTNNKNNNISTNVDIITRFFENENLNQAMLRFIEHRKGLKPKMTDYALQLILKKLNELSPDNETRIKILERSIENGWKGIFPLPRTGSNKSEEVDLPL